MMDLKNLMMLDEENLELMEEKNLPLVSAVCVESTNVSGKKSLAYAILPQKEEKENTGMISTKALKKLMRATGLAVPETIPTSNSGTDGSKAAELIQPYLGGEFRSYCLLALPQIHHIEISRQSGFYYLGRHRACFVNLVLFRKMLCLEQFLNFYKLLPGISQHFLLEIPGSKKE